MRFILPLLACLSVAAQAQEYAAVVGIHQTTATTTQAGATVDGKLNFKFGLGMAYELVPQVRFKTGAIYNQRYIESTVGTIDMTAELAYLDVPALVQYNFNEMVGVYGGLVIGINVADKVKVSQGTVTDSKVENLYPLAQAGVSLLFDDMIGFDLYYERGLGKIANNLKDFSTFGANFNYWF